MNFATLFMSPEQARKEAERQKEYRQRCFARGTDAEPPTQWDEDKTPWAPQLLIDASSYRPKQLFDTPLVSAAAGLKQHVRSPGGQFAYANLRLSKGSLLNCCSPSLQVGLVGFTDDVAIPVLYDVSRLSSGRENPVWMSLTPQEILTQRPGIRKARGQCLVGGLGLGWFLEKVVRKKSVTSVVLVEKSQDLLDWYGMKLIDQLREETGKPIVVIVDDVLEHIGRHGDETRYLVDIWETYPNYYEFLSASWRTKIDSVRHFWGWGVFRGEPRDPRPSWHRLPRRA